jgi:hypothetical protein
LDVAAHDLDVFFIAQEINRVEIPNLSTKRRWKTIRRNGLKVINPRLVLQQALPKAIVTDPYRRHHADTGDNHTGLLVPSHEITPTRHADDGFLICTPDPVFVIEVSLRPLSLIATASSPRTR